MSTAGVTAQEIRAPLKSSFLHGAQGLGSLKPCWSGQLENCFFNMDPVTVAYNLNASTPHHFMSLGHVSKPDPATSHGHPQTCSKVFPLQRSPAPLSPGDERASGSGPEEGCAIPGFSRLSVHMERASDEGVPPLPPPPPHTPGKNEPQLLSSPATPSGERSARPLPPLPIPKDLLQDDVDREVEFLTSSDTDFLLEDCDSSSVFKPAAQGRRSFRGCGQVNYAFFDAPPAAPKADEPSLPSAKQSGGLANACPPPPPLPLPHQLHRRLRRSHSGPAGSFNKPVVKVSSHFHRASPSSDDEKPEVPPRVPIPPRVLKPDYRRWSAEVASNSYSDEDKPPKVPPREPLSRSSSRTPSPKSLPSYLNGVMPPTQSFAPDPKYVSSKALQRQHSEGSGGSSSNSSSSSSNKIPCILPIIEKGKKVSSTHYYLLPERPPYLDKYEKFFREAEESSPSVEGRQQQQQWSKAEGDMAEVGTPTPTLKASLEDLVKRKPLSCVASP